MKNKKIIVLTIFALIVILFFLTGCTNKEENNNKQIDNKQEIKENDVDRKEYISVESINYNKFGIAKVKSIENNTAYYYAVNKNGKIIADLSGNRQYGETVINKNYVSVLYSSNSSNAEYTFEVYDTDGNLVITKKWDNTHTEYDKYFCASESKYFLVSHNVIDFSGNHTLKYRIIDENENIIYEAEEGKIIKYMGKDIFICGDGEDTGVVSYIDTYTDIIAINCEDKNNIKVSDFDTSISSLDSEHLEQGVLCCSNKHILIDTWEVVDSHYSVRGLSNDIFLNKNTYLSVDELSSDTQMKICDIRTGEELKDLSDSKVEDIEYYNGAYYVYSETGFFYIMDDNFNYLLEPQKRETLELYGTASGVLVDGSDTIDLIDNKGNVILNLSNEYKITTIRESFNENNLVKVGKISETNSAMVEEKYFDIENKKFIEVYK